MLRRSLAGFRAHECMYAWVYLTDLLAHGRLRDLLETLPAESRRDLLRELDGPLWSRVDRSQVDPHHQLSRGAYEAVSLLSVLAAEAGEARPVLVELGSTFFASRTKLAIVDRIARERFADWPKLEPEWVGIDNSRFMHDATRALHHDAAIRIVEDYAEVTRADRFSGFLSRFVASYAFPRGEAFARYLTERFPVAVVEDAYSTTGEDVAVHNHGQPEVFFSIPQTFGALEAAGFEIRVLEAYPDFPAGAAPCHVVRYLALRRGILTQRARERLGELALDLPAAPASAATLLSELNARVPESRWRSVEAAKQRSPVWGPTQGEPASPLRQAARDLFDRYVRFPSWRRYRMGGTLAVQEIARALRDETRPS